MITSLRELMSGLEADLFLIEKQEENTLTKSKAALLRIRQACRELSTRVLPEKFKSKEEEIVFFKELKPHFFGKMYYYNELFAIESNRPVGDNKTIKKYLKEHFERIFHHYQYNRHLYEYYRSEETSLDHLYFVRIPRFNNKYDQHGNLIPCEDDYSSFYDTLLAGIIANEMLKKYLREQIDRLEHPEEYNSEASSPVSSYKKIAWTESKTALIELLYALQESRCFNNGNITMKELVSVIGSLTKTDLNDYYKVYFELKNRSHRTKFLDSLKSALEQRMDTEDENDGNTKMVANK